MKPLIFFIIFCFFMFIISCEGSDNEAVFVETEAAVVIPDSTEYYDSLYAPLRYSLDTFFLNRHTKSEFYGTVLFAEKGRVIFKNAYGYATIKTKDTLTTEHTFQLASASKPFTAVAILQLYEQGKLQLTDDVRKYIPGFPYDSINIHQLLCHRSGLSQYTHFCDSPDSIWPHKNISIHNDEVISIMNSIVPIVNYPPNHKHYYCNTNYLLLASIVAKVSGVSFESYLQHNIFDKAEMSHTVLYNRENKNDLIMPVTGYLWNYNVAGDIYLNGVLGDKGVYSSVEDLFKFDQALYNNSLLKKETLDLAITAHNETEKNGQNYGYGFRLYPETAKGPVSFHTGWWEGFRTYFIRIPEREQTIIVLTNIKRGPFLSVLELIDLQ